MASSPCDILVAMDPGTAVDGGAPSVARRTPVEFRGFADPPRDEGAWVEKISSGVLSASP